MKFNVRISFFFAFAMVACVLGLLGTAVMAQEEPPTPYAGLKNPFPWDDATSQEAGKAIYQRSCLACHGADGTSIAAVNSGTASFSKNMEDSPDFYFWIFSEGRLNKGMPPFKSTLSEEQRWQTLTHLWSLGKEASDETKPPTEKPAGTIAALLLSAPAQTDAGQPLNLKASLHDADGKAIPNATVKFYLKADFFATGLAEIGDVLTDDTGTASLQYTPRETDKIDFVARYEGDEASTTVAIVGTSKSYEPEVGIKFPTLGKDIIFPQSSLTLNSMNDAPLSVLRLPGGILSWLLLLTAVVILIWSTYFRVMYQILHIPIASEIRDTNTRLIPLIGLAVIVTLGTMLVLMLITGPYSHHHLLPM